MISDCHIVTSAIKRCQPGARCPCLVHGGRAGSFGGGISCYVETLTPAPCAAESETHPAPHPATPCTPPSPGPRHTCSARAATSGPVCSSCVRRWPSLYEALDHRHVRLVSESPSAEAPAMATKLVSSHGHTTELRGGPSHADVPSTPERPSLPAPSGGRGPQAGEMGSESMVSGCWAPSAPRCGVTALEPLAGPASLSLPSPDVRAGDGDVGRPGHSGCGGASLVPTQQRPGARPPAATSRTGPSDGPASPVETLPTCKAVRTRRENCR